MLGWVASVLAVPAALLLWRYLSGGRLKVREARARQRRFHAGEEISVPVLLQACSTGPPADPPSTFTAHVHIGIRSGAPPRLTRGNLALDQGDFDNFWTAWAEGRAAGTVIGRDVDNRYWYTAVPRTFPRNESYLLLMNLSDWRLLAEVMTDCQAQS